MKLERRYLNTDNMHSDSYLLNTFKPVVPKTFTTLLQNDISKEIRPFTNNNNKKKKPFINIILLIFTKR